MAILFLVGSLVSPLVSANENATDPDHVDDTDDHADDADDHADDADDHVDDADEHAEEEDAPPEVPGFGLLGAIVPLGIIAYMFKRRT